MVPRSLEGPRRAPGGLLPEKDRISRQIVATGFFSNRRLEGRTNRAVAVRAAVLACAASGVCIASIACASSAAFLDVCVVVALVQL